MSQKGWDLIVIGSGLAGTVAALYAAEQGKKVLLIEGDSDCASAWAQGGIVYPSDDDAQILKDDILTAGCKINNIQAIEAVVQEGQKLIEKWFFEKTQVPFDRTQSGQELDRALEAAHSKARILHVKDHTGAAIMQSLRDLLEKQKLIERMPGVLVDLLVSDRHDKDPSSVYAPSVCRGAYVFHKITRQVEACVAPAVVIASGGFSALFEHATGPRTLRGDGIAAAHRAGARTLHLEYVQFHPTALYIPHERRHLLSEALRGAGAKLLNSSLKPFVDELAPRDVVARAIHNVLLHEGVEHVWLDCRKIENFVERFPSLNALLLSKGINPLNDLVPVVPAAHYTLGGIWTDSQGRSSMKGLYAAGEVACTGLHGANRLASTSLLDALVFGQRASAAAIDDLEKIENFDFEPYEWMPGEEKVDPALLQQDWQLLRRTLWNYVGLVRSPSRLHRAERMLLDLRRDVESFYKKAALNESLIGLRHAVLVGTLLLYAALRNPRSLGTHHIESSHPNP